MSDTNEAFVVFKPDSYRNQKLYKEILNRLNNKFDIKAMWPKVSELKILELFSLGQEYEGQRFLCAILKAKDKDTSSLNLVKEVIGNNSDPKKCMLGSIRRDLGGDRDLLLYSQNQQEVIDHIASWRPIFIKPKYGKDGYGKDGYGKDGYEEKEII